MIRRAGPDDVATVRALRLEALSSAPTAYGSTHAREVAYDDAVWIDRLQPGANPTFLWEDAARSWAMVVGARSADEAGVVHLFAMWVDPARRGGGAADELVEAVCDWARAVGAEVVRLHVTAGNDRAERLYRRCRFARTGRVERRDRDGRIEFEMERRLE